MATIRTLTTVFESKIGGFLDGLKRMQKGLSRWRRRMAQVGDIITGINSAFALMGRIGGAVSRQFADTFGFADEMAKVSDRLGIMPERLAEIRLAAKLSGVEFRQLELGLQRMGRRVSQAAHGTGEAQQAIKDMGLDAKALSRLSIDDMFKRISKELDNTARASRRIELAQKIFDSEGVKLVQITQASLQQAAKDVKDFGLNLSRMDLRMIERANDAFTRLKAAVRGFKLQLATFAAPLFEQAIGLLIELRKRIGDPRVFLEGLAVGIARVAGHLRDAFRALRQELALMIGVSGLALKELPGMSRLGETLTRIADRIDAPGIGFMSRKDVSELVHLRVAAGASVEESVDYNAQSSAARFELFMRRFFKGVEGSAEKSLLLDKFRTAIGDSVGNLLGSVERRLAGQISPTRMGLGGGTPFRVQPVRVEGQSNVIQALKQIERNTRRSGGAVVQP